MTATERFNKWWGKQEQEVWQHGPVILEPAYKGGYAQGCADAKAMRGRCKQCAQAIEEGMEPKTGIVKALWCRVFNSEASMSIALEDAKRLQRFLDSTAKELALAIEALKVYRANPRYAEVEERVWRIRMDEFQEELVFRGRPLDAMNYFAGIFNQRIKELKG